MASFEVRGGRSLKMRSAWRVRADGVRPDVFESVRSLDHRRLELTFVEPVGARETVHEALHRCCRLDVFVLAPDGSVDVTYEVGYDGVEWSPFDLVRYDPVGDPWVQRAVLTGVTVRIVRDGAGDETTPAG